MLILRVLGVLCLIGVVACVASYLVSGNRRFLSHALWIFRFAIAVLLVFVGLLALERVLMPMV